MSCRKVRACCFLVNFRAGLILGGKLNKAAYFFDSLLLYVGFMFLFLAYFLLVSFWAGVCSKRGAVGNWFNSRMQKLLVAFIVATLVVYTIIPFVDTFADFVYIQVLVNTSVGIYLITLCVGSTFQGFKILRILSDFQIKDRAIVGSVTRLCLAASSTLTAAFVIFIYALIFLDY